MAFVIVRLDRRELVWINVTTSPTAEWIARQITEAFPWDEGPRYLIRDRDRIYGAVVARRSIRRECLDHVIVLGEVHLRRIRKSYAQYDNGTRTHLSLNKDSGRYSAPIAARSRVAIASR